MVNHPGMDSVGTVGRCAMEWIHRGDRAAFTQQSAGKGDG